MQVSKPFAPDSDALVLKNDISLRTAVERGARATDWKKLQTFGDLYGGTKPFDHYDTTGTWGPVVYSRDNNGWVTVEGMIKWLITPTPNTNQIIGFFPVGYRPFYYTASQAPPVSAGSGTASNGGIVSPSGTNNNTVPVPNSLRFLCIAQSGVAQIAIYTTGSGVTVGGVSAVGAVVYEKAAVGSPGLGEWISLSNVRFYAGPQ